MMGITSSGMLIVLLATYVSYIRTSHSTGTFTTALQLTDKVTTKAPVEVCTFRCGGLLDIAIHVQRG